MRPPAALQDQRRRAASVAPGELVEAFKATLTPEAAASAIRAARNKEGWPTPVNRQLEISPAQEMEVWASFSEFHSRMTPRCKFSEKGIANAFERYRRQRLCAVFIEFSMRRTDDEVRLVFQSVQGDFSLGSFVCWCHPPPKYMLWFYEGLPRHSLANLGVKVLKKEFAKRSSEHAAVVREIVDRMKRYRLVENVMER